MFKNFEIKLNSVQSILLIISIFAIGILSFALGFTLGKNSSPDIIAIKDSSQESVPHSSQIEKRAEDVTQPPPAVSENHVASSEKTIQKEPHGTIQPSDKTKTPDAGKLTFFKTLPETKSSPPSERLKTQTMDKGQKKEDVRKESTSQKIIPAPQKQAQIQNKTHEPMAKPPDTKTNQSPPLQPFYTVQAGAFKTMDDASKLKSRLEGKGYQSYITTYDTPDGKWFRVRIGQFKTKEQAESAAKKLKTEENLATFIAAYK
ncbi:MAG: SPOR domain-containing protein [Nitrospinae bacterium]|nr:SPOR domain-containing protein [Nitrospinota bacterium]